MRNPIGIFTEVWAGTGDRSPIADFDKGFDSSYEVDALPDRQNMNDVLAKATALGLDVNQGGAGLDWDAGVTYNNKATVLGSDNLYYVAVQSNLNKEPSANVPTFWVTLETFLGITALKTDAEWVNLTDSSYGLSGLSQNTSGTWTFKVSEFAGGGLDPSEIRELTIYCASTGDNNGNVTIRYMKQGSGAFTNLYVAQYEDDSNFADTHNVELRIPVNPNQENVVIEMTKVGQVLASFTLSQAKQRK